MFLNKSKNLLKLRTKMDLTAGKIAEIKSKDMAISKAKDLVTKGKDLAVKRVQDLTQKSLATGVATTQKALSRGLNLVTAKVGQIASRIDPTSTLDKIKTPHQIHSSRKYCKSAETNSLIVNLVLS